MADLSPVVAGNQMGEWLASQSKMLANLLKGKSIDPGTFLQAVRAEAIKQPGLANAIQTSVDTLINTLSVCAAHGFMPGSDYGRFYIMPFWNSAQARTEVKFIVGYKGLLDVAYRNPRVFSVRTNVAYKGEPFEYDPGENRIMHKWVPEKRTEKLEDVHATYCVVKLTTPNGQHVESDPLIRVCTIAEILKSKQRSKAMHGPWRDFPIPMAERLPIRRLFSKGEVPSQMEMTTLIGAESAQLPKDDPEPTSGTKRGVAGLKASIGIEPERPAMPDTEEGRLMLLRELAPNDTDLDLLPADEVFDRLRPLTKEPE